MAIEYVADFETTSVRVYDNKGKLDPVRSEAWVCAWAIIPVELDPDPSHIIHGRDIGSFMDAVAAIYLDLPMTGKKQKRQKLSVFTHNLKFDGDFIMSWLLHGNGEITQETRENVLYNFTAVWEDGEVEVTFRDSLKIFPQSAAKIGELYGIPKLKGEWDYDKFRWPDERTPISPEEWSYVDHDVMIISRALADYRAQGYVENTQAAIAYNDRLRRTYPKFRKTIAQYLKKSDYERYVNSFPKDIKPLPFKLHEHLSMGYFGGISYLNPRYANLPLEFVYSYDVHSMYPDKMANAWLPVGLPMIIENPTQEEAWRMIRTYHCVMVDIEDLSLKLKSEDHFPALMFPTSKGSIRMEGKILRCEHESICLTGIDCRIMESEYDISSCVITRIYLFKSVQGHYKNFVDYWMQIKSDADRILNDENASAEDKAAAKIRRSLAKVMMNSSYGKDGTKLLRKPHHTRLDQETDLLVSDPDIEVAEIEYYLPSAIFICALARQQLWKAVKLLRREFIYCDTDSVKVTARGREILESSPDFDIDDYRLGSWGYEGEYRTAKFVRQKTYSYEQWNKKHRRYERHYVVCGAPDDIKAVMDIEDFAPGMVIDLDKIHRCKNSETGKPLQGRLLPVRVRGGIILEETGFQISKIDNWDEQTGRNMPIDFARLCAIIK